MPSTRSLAHLSVVLVSPRNTLNIGAVARAMSNFGANDLRVANIFYKDFRSASSAVGPSAALLRAALEFPTVAEAIHDAQLVIGTSGAADGKPWLQPIERLERSAVRMRATLDRGLKVALLFGSEKFGLSNDDMSHCHALLRIPTREEHPSMNLGQAAALCLYELARLNLDQSDPAALPPEVEPERDERWLPQEFPRDAGDRAPAPSAAVERMTALLAEALEASEFPGMGSPSRGRQLRNYIRRLRFSGRDAELTTGFLRQMLWKLRGGSSTLP